MKANKNFVTNKMYLSLMIPFILSTVTQPLLGAIDIAVIGRLNNEVFISGVGIGSLIFNTMYWMFGFLRVSTTGYSAQNLYKSKNENAVIFLRPIILALFMSLFFILFNKNIFNLAIRFIGPSSEVISITKVYFSILIYGAPFVLFNYVILGWLMGKGNIRGSLTMQILGNVLNIFLDILFVVFFKKGVMGVAYATFISQVTSFFIGLYFIIPYGYFKSIDFIAIFNKKEILNILTINKNLMIRTFFLLLHNNLIMSASSKLGVDILATNSILLQIIAVISYSFDGIANTSSVFSGRALGLKDNFMMKQIWKRNLQWGFIFVLLTTTTYIFLSENIFMLFYNLENILNLSKKFSIWVLLYPITAFLGLTYYGVFTGTNKTLPVAMSTVGAFAFFLLSYNFIFPKLGNNGVWISFLIFYFFRGALLVPQLKKTLT